MFIFWAGRARSWGVVNVDGSPNHGTKFKLHDTDADALRSRGFKISSDNLVEWLELGVPRSQVLLASRLYENTCRNISPRNRCASSSSAVETASSVSPVERVLNGLRRQMRSGRTRSYELLDMRQILEDYLLRLGFGGGVQVKP